MDHAIYWNVKVATNNPRSVLKGERVLRYREGIWNGIWSDMIETSCMKFGKSPNGIIGKTTKPRTLQIWTKSQHLYSEVLQSFDSIREIYEITMTTHKDEKDGRMKADLINEVKLQNFLETCLHPLNYLNHPESTLCNVYTGQLSRTKMSTNRSRLVQNKWFHSRDHYQMVFDQR